MTILPHIFALQGMHLVADLSLDRRLANSADHP